MSANENDGAGAKDRSPSPAIKSTAVVKYTSVQSPVGYARLQCNTDLNLPPSNWLSSAIDSYGLKQILRHSTGFSSFRMAHMFPDSVGEVDVISGAECIKTLLKLPYHPNGTVSMMVHRVENTLLLDEFDIYEYMMKSEWSWLKTFFYENILKTMSEQEKIKMLGLQNKGSPSLQLTSKFLCHSVASLPDPLKSSKTELQPASSQILLDGPFLPEPEVRPEGPTNEHIYNRNVLWTFENIQMLIGSDLPIFGGTDRPCVSLRLRDAREPINVLTGIDYWLDNLMCNVPEVLMCYHLDGIVQKYEPMKTEDLPTMDGSKFSPKVIKNVAQNILSFLKANATKSGHTYWLFKGSHDDVVKLYDLTSLCGGLDGTANNENPFITPVAMLLYRVARNMRLTQRTKHVKMLLENAIKLLSVERHPQIVASSHYMLSDLYVPATTNPACPDFKDESSSDSDCEDDDLTNLETDAGMKSKEQAPQDSQKLNRESPEASSQLALKIRGLALHDIGKSIRPAEEKSKSKTSIGLGTEPPDRCGKALQHALRGLQALHKVTTEKCKEEERERVRQQRLIEEQHPKMANPYEPIKMNYEPLDPKKKVNQNTQLSEKQKEHVSRGRRRKRERKISDKAANSLLENKSNVDKNAILIRKENKMFPTWHEPNRDDNFAWKLHLKTLLYEKICLAYATLAEHSYSHEQYGFSLKYIHMASKCQKLLSNMIIRSRVVDASCLIGRAGDNYFQISKHWNRMEQFKRQFENDHATDSQLRLEINRDLEEESECLNQVDECELEIFLPDDMTDAMQLSCDNYKRALLVTESEKRNELLRRLGSVNNELGVRYMHNAQLAYMKHYDQEESEDTEPDDELLKQCEDLSKKSLECLEEAMEIFKQVNDVPNLALLYCNKGRYMRFRAHCEPGSFSAERRRLYNDAESQYMLALKVLGGRETCGALAVWDLVSWELSCHTYTRATLMQDHNVAQHHNDPNDVADALKHALKYCYLSPGPRQYLYQFRAAMIYHRLGSLYHKQYRETSEEGPKRRTLANLTRTNYEQASKLLATLEDTAMFLTVQMEHVGLLECQAGNSPNLKLKSLQTALQLLRQSHSIIKLIKERDTEEPKDTVKIEKEEQGIESEYKLLNLLENRLHFILKSLIQYCRTRSNKDYEKMSEMYKKLYSASLKIKKADPNDLKGYAGSICEVLSSMDDISSFYGF